MEAMLLSFMYLFIDRDNTNVGAGDLATGPYQTGLTRGTFMYKSTHALVTKMYNELVNASLPLSVLEFPSFLFSLFNGMNLKYLTKELSIAILSKSLA